jgi:hypothetical protein
MNYFFDLVLRLLLLHDVDFDFTQSICKDFRQNPSAS